MTSRFMFSHAALELRSSQGSLSHSIAGAKQASVLFDEIIFERRLGSLEGPPERPLYRLVSAREAKELEASGGRVAEWAGSSDFFTDDPEAPGSGHGSWNGLHDLLCRLGCEWTREVIYDPSLTDATPGLPEEERPKRELRALAYAYDTSLYQPTAGLPLLGSTALAILVPDIHRLPWQAIGEFRDHPGSREARHRLRDFDAQARRGALDISDVRLFEQSVAHEISRALLAAWAETRPRVGLELAKEAAKTGIGFIPLVGPAVSASAAAAEIAAETAVHDRTWLSALWNLARHAGLGS